MDKPLEEEYFIWLYSQAASVRFKNPVRTYWSLLRQLHSTEFVDFVPNDDNRAEDGRELRLEFQDEMKIDVPRDWLDQQCSFLEMLVALSRVMAFEAGGHARGWFWHLMETLDLRQYTDSYYDPEDRFTKRKIDRVLRQVNLRTYDQNGRGGLFPLEHPNTDQREVEIWYQMHSYLLERI